MSNLSEDDIETLYNRYLKTIYRFFYYKFLCRETAEDLTSETFLTFISHLKKQTEVKEPAKYLFGIARHLFLKHLRKKYHSLSTVTLDENFNFQEIEQAQEGEDLPWEEKLKKYLPLIPEKQKTVIELRLLEKKTLAEIAHQLEKDMNYVKVTQRRAIKSLKKIVACTL